jgi:hypothetical protein
VLQEHKFEVFTVQNRYQNSFLTYSSASLQDSSYEEAELALLIGVPATFSAALLPSSAK